MNGFLASPTSNSLRPNFDKGSANIDNLTFDVLVIDFIWHFVQSKQIIVIVERNDKSLGDLQDGQGPQREGGPSQYGESPILVLERATLNEFPVPPVGVLKSNWHVAYDVLELLRIFPTSQLVLLQLDPQEHAFALLS